MPPAIHQRNSKCGLNLSAGASAEADAARFLEEAGNKFVALRVIIILDLTKHS